MTRAKKPKGGPDRATKAMIRNAADEAAAKAGCRFDEERAAHAVEWIEKTCRLYEGDAAGQMMQLADWQRDTTRRLFGWVKFSEDWGREVRRFRRASIWVPKKNGKSPTLAAWGLYMLAGDGEQGQKVYSVARDGKQAMISHTHAVEMVKRSPELSDLCDINKGTGQITYLPTSSVYKIVAGDNMNSQEGLNGSLMVDETHVVDRRLMKILRGAGISRSEPLHIEVSTAGNNPDGYGKEQFDYGRKVESGEFPDESLLYVAYAAPQDLADADLDADPAKYGKMANPSWGRIVKPSEFLADYQRSKASIADLADFKMYRTNIWQNAASPWLKGSDWEACKREFDEDSLEGQECWAGLDLSKTQDMTALVLAFHGEEEESYRLLPYFWLPEETAKRLDHLAPFRAWAAAGFLTLTPGSVIDYGFIRARFRKLAQRFKIMELAYDRTYAEETTQALEQGVTDDAGKVIEEGTGVSRFVFPQNVMGFAEPTADFERAVIAHRMRHNGHPVLAWQAGHVKVKTDGNNNRRPVKPTRDDHRKIDGIVAAIMAVARARLAPRGDSVYDSRGILAI